MPIHLASSALTDPVTGVVVLGMSRSGTSAVTGMFVSAGFFAGHGDELMLPDPRNPRGYFENMKVFAANEEILTALDGTFFDPPPADAQIQAGTWAQPKLRALLTRLLEEAGDAPVALKDPRIGGMLPLWDSLIRGVLHPVLVIRDPVEIALSLCRRDGTPIAFGLAAWEVHMTTLLAGLRGRTVTVVRYEHLLHRPELPGAIVASVAARLSPACAAHVDPDCAAIALEPGLRRNRLENCDHEQHLTGRQLALWRQLEALPFGEQVIVAPPDWPEPSAAATQTLRAERDRLELLGQIAAQEEELARCAQEARRALDEAENVVSAELARSAALAHELRLARISERGFAQASHAGSRRLEQALDSIRQLEEQLEVIRQSRSWQMSRPLRWSARRARSAQVLKLARRGRSAAAARLNPGPSETAAQVTESL